MGRWKLALKQEEVLVGGKCLEGRGRRGGKEEVEEGGR